MLTTVSSLCNQLGIGRATYYFWLNKWVKSGNPAPEPAATYAKAKLYDPGELRMFIRTLQAAYGSDITTIPERVSLWDIFKPTRKPKPGKSLYRQTLSFDSKGELVITETQL